MAVNGLPSGDHGAKCTWFSAESRPVLTLAGLHKLSAGTDSVAKNALDCISDSKGNAG